MNNKGSWLTLNSLINLFPKVNDVLHCDFSIRHLHTLEFFSFALLGKPLGFPFHLINYLPSLSLVLASVRSGLAGGLGLRDWGAIADVRPLISFRGEKL